jgi:hypothetical protein
MWESKIRSLVLFLGRRSLPPSLPPSLSLLVVLLTFLCTWNNWEATGLKSHVYWLCFFNYVMILNCYLSMTALLWRVLCRTQLILNFVQILVFSVKYGCMDTIHYASRTDIVCICRPLKFCAKRVGIQKDSCPMGPAAVPAIQHTTFAPSLLGLWSCPSPPTTYKPKLKVLLNAKQNKFIYCLLTDSNNKISQTVILSAQRHSIQSVHSSRFQVFKAIKFISVGIATDYRLDG